MEATCAQGSPADEVAPAAAFGPTCLSACSLLPKLLHFVFEKIKVGRLQFNDAVAYISNEFVMFHNLGTLVP